MKLITKDVFLHGHFCSWSCIVDESKINGFGSLVDDPQVSGPCGLAMRKEIHPILQLQALLLHLWFGKHEAAFRQDNKMEWHGIADWMPKFILRRPL